MGALRDGKRAVRGFTSRLGRETSGCPGLGRAGPAGLETTEQTAIRNGRMRCDGPREQIFIVAHG